ncbi:33599_t:CDS:2, partial [Racocetra persica]
MHENILGQKLTFLSEFVNLEEVYAGGNFFYGSLEPLKNLSKLKCLDIIDNNITSGLEYLPSSIDEFYCYIYSNPQSEMKKLVNQLEPYAIDIKKGKYDLEKLRRTKSNSISLQLASAQEWLDKNYPKEKRSEVYEIYINEQLEGNLDMTDFTYWDDSFVIKLVNAQGHLNKEYPDPKRKEKETKITINNKLEGDLDLSGFVNLESLNLVYNRLNLNPLLDNCNSEKLSILELSYNNFPVSDLTPFSKFVNLKTLHLSNNPFT